MPRLPYADSCRQLQQMELLDPGDIPALPDRPPRHDDETPGVSFFRTELAEIKLEHLTLPHTFISRSEIRDASFHDTDLAGSVANWNDFIRVDFTGADLSRTDLRACLFERVRFTGAVLADADLRYCGFKHCDFTGADLTNARLTQKAGAALHLTPEQQGMVDWQSEEGEEPAGG